MDENMIYYVISFLIGLAVFWGPAIYFVMVSVVASNDQGAETSLQDFTTEGLGGLKTERDEVEEEPPKFEIPKWVEGYEDYFKDESGKGGTK